MAEKKGVGHAYNIDFLNVVFAATSAAGASSAEKKGQAVQELEKRLIALDLEVQKLTAERGAVQKELGQYTGKVADVAKQLETIHAEETRLRKVLNVVAPSVTK